MFWISIDMSSIFSQRLQKLFQVRLLILDMLVAALTLRANWIIGAILFSKYILTCLMSILTSIIFESYYLKRYSTYYKVFHKQKLSQKYAKSLPYFHSPCWFIGFRTREDIINWLNLKSKINYLNSILPKFFIHYNQIF